MDLTGFIRKLDIDALAKNFMQKMKVGPFEMYFVVAKYLNYEHYEMLGMAYAEGAAKAIEKENRSDILNGEGSIKILRLDLGRLLKIVEDMGAAQEVL